MKVLGLVLTLCTGLVWTSTSLAQTQAGEAVVDDARVPLVQTMRVGVDEQMLMIPGTVRAARRSVLSFPFPGWLVELPVRAGQWVTEGELLARLDERDLRDRLELERARLRLARADYDRFSRLSASRVSPITQAEVDRARADLEISEARFAQAGKLLEDASILAPFDAVVAARMVDNFEQVGAEQPILLLEAQDRLEVLIDLPERLISRVREISRGEPVAETEFAVLPGRLFPVYLSAVVTDADPVTRTFRITLSMDRPEGLNILPGMTATVHTREALVMDPVLRIPPTALAQSEGDRGLVWVMDADTRRIQGRQVVLGDRTAEGLEVKQGLLGGEVIVAAGASLLRDGMTIQPFRVGMLSE